MMLIISTRESTDTSIVAAACVVAGAADTIELNMPSMTTAQVSASLMRHQRLEQLIQDLLHGHLDAREDRRVALGELAAFGLPKLHHQVKEILGFFRLE